MRLNAQFKAEQAELTSTITESEKRLSDMEQKSTDLRSLLSALREATDITELNQTIVNKLIQRIEVHSNEKKHSHNGVKVEIYFTAVGMISLPDEQEIMKLIQEIQQKKGGAKIIRLPA